jgi:hypothetical protein
MLVCCILGKTPPPFWLTSHPINWRTHTKKNVRYPLEVLGIFCLFVCWLVELIFRYPRRVVGKGNTLLGSCILLLLLICFPPPFYPSFDLFTFL